MRVDLDDGQHALARTVVVATGARWRTLAADNVERFTGAGVYHAAMATDAERCRGEDVIVVGRRQLRRAGGVAPVARGAQRPRRHPRRRPGRDDVALPARAHRVPSRTSSSSPAPRSAPSTANGRLEHADLRSRADGSVERVAVSAVFVMIGAEPCTEAVHTDARPRRGRLHHVRRRRRGRVRGTEPMAARPTGSRNCSRRSGRASSPRATSAPGRRSAWPAPSATAPWPCASPTRSCRPERPAGRPAAARLRRDARGGRRGVVVRAERRASPSVHAARWDA